jgi:hypothetical protein
MCLDVAGPEVVPLGAAGHDPDRPGTGPRVPQRDRSLPLVRQPAVTPLHEGDQCREQVDALVGEDVLLAGSLAGLAVGLLAEQSLLHQLTQPGRGDSLAQTGAADELLEPSCSAAA